MKATIMDNDLNPIKSKVIKQSDLTPGCWSIQMWGISACETCEYLNTDECGGKETRELIRTGQYPRGGLTDQKEKKNG